MLKTRVHTAILLVIGFLALLFLASNDVWAFVTLIATLIAVWEWGKLISLNSLQNRLYITTVAIAGFVLHATKGYEMNDIVVMSLLAISVAFWLIVAPFWLASLKSINNRFGMSVLGFILMLAMWLGLIILHQKGAIAILLLLATIWLADSAAYFAGKKFGKRKLAPNVSPGKTWEGVFGALLAVTIYGVVLCYVFAISPFLLVFLWLLVALSIIGDLLESLLKRQAGVKDSSHLLPGHGGVLDRIDGLLPTVTFTALCVLVIRYLAL